jgi:hypothetical protein
MTLSAIARHSRQVAAGSTARCVVIAALAMVALAGCGGSSKPAYCSARANLQNSIKGITSLSVSSGVSALEAEFQKVKTDANKVITQAKSDFPTETSAIRSSVDTLTTAVDALKANPSATHIAAVASAVPTVVSSVKTFTDATKSKCS